MVPAVLAVLAVPEWPAAPPCWQGALLLICISHPAGATRALARTRIRTALCAALAQSLGLDPAQVTLAATPGSAPHLLSGGAPCAIWSSAARTRSRSSVCTMFR